MKSLKTVSLLNTLFCVFVISLLSATPASAHSGYYLMEPPDDTDFTAPEDVPRDPALTDIPPLDPELASENRLFGDPHLGATLIGFGDIATMGASVGIDLHLRLGRFHSLVGLTSFGYGAQFVEPEFEEDGRGRYFYAFGIGYGFRSSNDAFRLVTAALFAGIRTEADEVLAHGTVGLVRVEIGLSGQRNGVDPMVLMLRLGVQAGPGWDDLEELGVLYRVDAGLAASF